MRAFLNTIHAAYPKFTEHGDVSQDSASLLSSLEQFARFIIAAYESGDRDELKPAFAIMESGLASGDAEVREAVAVGFFETLQNVASHRAFGAGAFRGYLGDNSRQAWEELNAAWEGKSSLMEVVAEEAGGLLKVPWWQFWRRRRRSTPAEMLEKVENPELRAIIEGMTREDSKPGE